MSGQAERVRDTSLVRIAMHLPDSFHAFADHMIEYYESGITHLEPCKTHADCFICIVVCAGTLEDTEPARVQLAELGIQSYAVQHG